MSINTVDDLNSVPHANTVIYELHLRYLVPVALDSFADCFDRGGAVKEFICVLDDGRFFCADDLTCPRVYV